MRRWLGRCAAFARREAVLCAAVVLAAGSAVLVPPDAEYLSYLDWDTLALLFGLMAVVQGFQKAGFFGRVGSVLLRRVGTTRGLTAVLVFLPFFSSMVITNDVALITFVPFGILVLKMAGQEKRLLPLVVLQTAAANLGSMLTPMGNPQNLYLYGRSGMGFWALCGLMLPYVLLSGACLLLLVLLRKPEPVEGVSVAARISSRRELLACTAGFALCLCGLFGVLPPLLAAAVIGAFLLVRGRDLLARIDYALLGTFAAFFVFVGNIGRVDAFREFLVSILAGQERLVAVLASQIISNVPAALLLAGFSDRWEELSVGCNLGGRGTLIASMASLISYRMVAAEAPARRGKYLLWFTLCNAGLLAVLLAAGWGLSLLG